MAIIFVAIFQFHVNAQDKSEACFTIAPKNAYIRLDGGSMIDLSSVTQPYCLELETGKHLVEIWAPYFAIHRDTIDIVPGQTKNYTKPLSQLSDDYKSYHQELKAFHKLQIKRTLAATGVVIGNLFLTSVIVTAENNVSDKKEQVEATKKFYLEAIGTNEIETAKSVYFTRKEVYEKARRQFYVKLGVGIPTALLTYYASWKFLKKLKSTKPVAPVYKEKNPWAGTRLTLDEGIGYGGIKLIHAF